MNRLKGSGKLLSGTITINKKATIVRVSKAALAIVGPEARMLKGLSILLLLPSEYSKLERQNVELLETKDLLLREMQHRMANSLQIIASFLMLKARAIHQEEARLLIEDAHLRIIALASLQHQLEVNGNNQVNVHKYLENLCHLIDTSMIHGRPISLKVCGCADAAVKSQTAVSFGLIVTELIINCLKYAFLEDTPGEISVTFISKKGKWLLRVDDNGTSSNSDQVPGLGSIIIEALARQLSARVERSMSSLGTSVSINHA